MNDDSTARSIDLICSLLRGESPPSRAYDTEETADAFLRLARAHGVTPLLDERFSNRDLDDAWPASIRVACHEDALGRAMQELALRAELTRVLAALGAAGVRPLILKGTALAYGVYPRPALRMRGDTDLLVPPAAAGTVAVLLEELGYRRAPHSNGEAVSCQATWSRTDAIGAGHDLDVHWRPSNSQVLARELSYEDLATRAVEVPALGPDAWTLDSADTLMYACMHRAGHVNTIYYSGDDVMVGGDRLIWFYDMHLLVMSMPEADLVEFVERARKRRMRGICLDALQRTRECFGTAIPAFVLEALQVTDAAEPSTRYLAGRRLNQVLGDLVAAPDWRFRLKWLREFCFPAADYMHAKYPGASLQWLPLLYARRAAEGARKVLSRHGTGHPRF